jgi:hypothetical protein
VTHVLDHLFVFCSPGAPELAPLLARGLDIDLRREHPGQGTANVCIGFADGYLELLWLRSEPEARDPHVKPLGLHERARWRETRSSPFGVCVRPDAPGLTPPFASWDYRPKFLPAGMTIDMACNSGVLGEPMLFRLDRPFVPLGGRHALATRKLVRATLTVPNLAPMSMWREVRLPKLVIQDGDEHRLDLEFTDARGELDLRPALPLRLRF